jgi:toxin-antitoxin system PIN domain toxin
MLVDANILIYATDEKSRFHDPAREWLQQAMNGTRRVGVAWASLTAFVRIVTHPRASDAPLDPAEAWRIVEQWLDAPASWVPEPGPGHREILGRLLVDHGLRGNLVPDAVLAALCIEHGLDIVSADSDFARFAEIDWLNPVAL